MPGRAAAWVGWRSMAPVIRASRWSRDWRSPARRRTGCWAWGKVRVESGKLDMEIIPLCRVRLEQELALLLGPSWFLGEPVRARRVVAATGLSGSYLLSGFGSVGFRLDTALL